MHEPLQFLYDAIVLDMFCIERFNLRLKRVGEAVCNSRDYERSVRSSMPTKQFNDLQDGSSLREGLCGKCTPLADLSVLG